MKFNLDKVISEVVEEHTHGVIKYGELRVSCCRSTGDTLLIQDDNEILLEHEQAKELFFLLNSVFGD